MGRRDPSTIAGFAVVLLLCTTLPQSWASLSLRKDDAPPSSATEVLGKAAVPTPQPSPEPAPASADANGDETGPPATECTIHVAAKGSDTNGTGTAEKPYASIMWAIHKSPCKKPFIQLSAGTFRGKNNRNIQFNDKCPHLSGTSPFETILDIGYQGRAFLFDSGETNDCVVEKITIRNGAAPDGGGILCNGTGGTFRDVIVERNNVWKPGFGGGILLVNSDATFFNVTVKRNSGIYGGGVAILGGKPKFKDSAFLENAAAASGGGLYAAKQCAFEVENGLFRRNWAMNSGGGIAMSNGEGLVTKSLLAGNGAGKKGHNLHNLVETSKITFLDTKIKNVQVALKKDFLIEETLGGEAER